MMCTVKMRENVIVWIVKHREKIKSIRTRTHIHTYTPIQWEIERTIIPPSNNGALKSINTQIIIIVLCKWLNESARCHFTLWNTIRKYYYISQRPRCMHVYLPCDTQIHSVHWYKRNTGLERLARFISCESRFLSPSISLRRHNSLSALESRCLHILFTWLHGLASMYLNTCMHGVI